MGKPIFPPDRIPPTGINWEATLPPLPDPGFAGAVFVIIKGDQTRFASEKYIATQVARIWAGVVAQADLWDVLLVKTSRMDRLEACKVERDPLARKATAVFRGSDGCGNFAMNI